MSVNGALSDDEWGAWGKPEAAAKIDEVESTPNNGGNGFASEDNGKWDNDGGSKWDNDGGSKWDKDGGSKWDNDGGSKFKNYNQDNNGQGYQDRKGGYNNNRGGGYNNNRGGYNNNRSGPDNHFSSKRDDTDNRYNRDGKNNYNNRNQDDNKRNGNNYDRDNFKRDDSRENRGGYRGKRDSSKENRNYQHDDRSNGYKRDDSRENRGNRNARKRDDSDDSRGNYRNTRKNDYKRDDSGENRSRYRNKNDPFKRDDSSENRGNYRKPRNNRDDSDDSRKNYRNSKKDGRNDSRERRRRDDSRDKRNYRRDDDRDDDYRRNDSRDRRRDDSRDRRRNDSRDRNRNDSRDKPRNQPKRDYKGDDSSDSDFKGRRGRDAPPQNRDRDRGQNRDVDDLKDKFDRDARIDNNTDGFSSRTFIRGHKTSEHDNQTDDAAVPKRATFVPNDDQEDYELHVNSGINFDNYDKIPVEVTGENAPPSIASFADLSLPEFLSANIDSLKYAKLTPVQKYAIPIIDNKRDLMACAQTGSGKTAAFLIPIIKSIHENVAVEADAPAASAVAFPKALIMAPTRELCRQIFTAARHLSRGSNVKCAYIYGGIEMNKSRRNIQSSGCDILVATPGRLLHFLELVWISLRYMKFFVLDEADRMLDSEGFYESVNKIYTDAIGVGDDRTIQISMFSATFPNEIQSLARNLLKNYLFLAVGVVGSANSDVKQEIILADQRDKVNTAIEYIKSIPDEKTLIFVESKRMADFFGVKLGYLGFKATTIHGDREQEQREIALNDFKSGRVNFMVATNVAARGLDIPKVDNVINIDMPGDIDTYVHRIGRTGRCGNVGRAVSFFDEAKDIGLASLLVSKLEEANQEVADWLRLLASGASGCTGYGAGGGARRNNYKDTRRDVPVSKFVDNPNDEFMKGTNVDYDDAKPSSEWLED